MSYFWGYYPLYISSLAYLAWSIILGISLFDMSIILGIQVQRHYSQQKEGDKRKYSSGQEILAREQWISDQIHGQHTKGQLL